MARQQTIGILAAVMAFAGTAACHPRGRTPQAPPAVAPDVDRRRAMDLFHRGDFRRAQTILQRVTFELTPGTPELAEVRYYLAECSFQLGDYVQAASDFRKVADEMARNPNGLDVGARLEEYRTISFDPREHPQESAEIMDIYRKLCPGEPTLYAMSGMSTR